MNSIVSTRPRLNSRFEVDKNIISRYQKYTVFNYFGIYSTSEAFKSIHRKEYFINCVIFNLHINSLTVHSILKIETFMKINIIHNFNGYLY